MEEMPQAHRNRHPCDSLKSNTSLMLLKMSTMGVGKEGLHRKMCYTLPGRGRNQSVENYKGKEHLKILGTIPTSFLTERIG
jgi:hypothetical protein